MKTFRKAILASLFACSFVIESPVADFMFTEMSSYDPVTAFDFGYRRALPAVEITYLRTTVDSSHTQVSVKLDDPHFEIVAHSCPPALAKGRGCMIYFKFRPRGSNRKSEPIPGVFTASLVVSSKEGSAILEISGHKNSKYCKAEGLRLDKSCATPKR